jgi:glutamate formiminotransferase/formiminotetrahydrofolate cyclodeaminase
VPFSVLEKSVQAAKLSKRIAEIGNQNSLSDAGVAGLTARTAAIGAYYNVLINLQSITDKEFIKKTFGDAEKLKDQAVAITDEIQSSVCGNLKDALKKSES